ncbi:Uncharacterized protein Rs2_38822 [Raphanus sativus]|nr:Uncharacterized protein Rs2_38822 [Raphanus sativus]
MCGKYDDDLDGDINNGGNGIMVMEAEETTAMIDITQFPQIFPNRRPLLKVKALFFLNRILDPDDAEKIRRLLANRMANSKTAHYRRLRLISFLNYVFPKHEDDEDLNIVTGGLLIGLEMLLKRSKRENLLLVTHLMKSDQLLCFRLISQVGSSLRQQIKAFRSWWSLFHYFSPSNTLKETTVDNSQWKRWSNKGH